MQRLQMSAATAFIVLAAALEPGSAQAITLPDLGSSCSTSNGNNGCFKITNNFNFTTPTGQNNSAVGTSITATAAGAGTAVKGFAGGSGDGVQGTASGAGVGVRGNGNGSGSTSGIPSFLSPAQAGVLGNGQVVGLYGAATGSGPGTVDLGAVVGYSRLQFTHGIMGVYHGGDNQMAGVVGRTLRPGTSDPNEYDTSSVGVLGISGGTGVRGRSVGCGQNANCGFAPGVEGYSLGGIGVSGGSDATVGGIDPNTGLADWLNTRALGVLGSSSATSGAFAGVYGSAPSSANDQGGAVVGDVQGSWSAWAGNFIGDVQARGFYATSDARLKKDIKDSAYGLSELLKLRPVTYKWKQGNDPAEHNGLIAQEVQAVFPAAVRGGTKLSVDYGSIIPVMIKAIQQQQQVIQQQEARIASLERPGGAQQLSLVPGDYYAPLMGLAVVAAAVLAFRRRNERRRERRRP